MNKGIILFVFLSWNALCHIDTVENMHGINCYQIINNAGYKLDSLQA